VERVGNVSRVYKLTNKVTNGRKKPTQTTGRNGTKCCNVEFGEDKQPDSKKI